MNGPFHDYRNDIRVCLPVVGELIALFFLWIEELSHEFHISRDVSAIRHELFHHFLKNISQNMDYGLTHSVLMPSILFIT
jgi:hypothetical protein